MFDAVKRTTSEYLHCVYICISRHVFEATAEIEGLREGDLHRDPTACIFHELHFHSFVSVKNTLKSLGSRPLRFSYKLRNVKILTRTTVPRRLVT